MKISRIQHGQNVVSAVINKVNEIVDYLPSLEVHGDNKTIFTNSSKFGTMITSKAKSSAGVSEGGGESTNIYPVSFGWRPVVHMMYAPNMDWTLTANQKSSSSTLDPSTGILTESWRFQVDANAGQYYYNGLAVTGSDATNRATIIFTRYTSPAQEYTYNVVISWSRHSQTITFTETDEFSLYVYWTISSIGSAQFLVTKDRATDNTLKWPVGVLSADKVDKMVKIYNCCNVPTFMVSTVWTS